LDGVNALSPIKPRKFRAKDGREVVLRSIRWEDLDDCLEFINSLVEEGADILVDKKGSREEEADWLGKRLARAVKGEIIELIAEVDGKMVANSEVERRSGLMSHVGYLGIGIKADYRGIGIGTQIIQVLKEESKKAGLKVLVLDVFATNKTAQALYRKMGFEDAGRTPKAICKNGKYIDLVRMALEL
jgi:L-amino acid N-acyltransferase YncA